MVGDLIGGLQDFGVAFTIYDGLTPHQLAEVFDHLGRSLLWSSDHLLGGINEGSQLFRRIIPHHVLHEPGGELIRSGAFKLLRIQFHRGKTLIGNEGIQGMKGFENCQPVRAIGDGGGDVRWRTPIN